MTITEKLAYIKGLCEGLKLDDSSKEGKILLAVVDLLGDVTEQVSENEGDINQIFDELDRVYDEIDAIDEDLTDVEDALYDEDEDDDDWDYDDDEYDMLEDGDEDITDLYDEENPIYEITCPKCGEVYLPEALVKGRMADVERELEDKQIVDISMIHERCF